MEDRPNLVLATAILLLTSTVSVVFAGAQTGLDLGEESLATNDQGGLLVDIEAPAPGSTFGATEEITVEWTGPAPEATDFLAQDALYHVQLAKVGKADPVDEASTYDCETQSDLSTRCSTTVSLQGGGEYLVTVFTTASPTLIEDQLSGTWSAPQSCQLDQGTGTVQAVACDSVKVTADSTPPATTISPATDAWLDQSPSVELQCTDAGSGCATTTYTVDGSNPITYESPFQLDDGTHEITFWSTDEAGNVEAEQTQTIRIDTQDPTGDLVLDPAEPSGDDGWYLQSPDVTADCTDPSPSSGLAECQAQTDDDPSTDGHKTYELVLEDEAGNTGATETVTFKQDLNVPLIESFGPEDEGNDGVLESPSVDVTLTADDGDGAGVSIREVWAENASTGEETEHVEVQDGQTTVTLDVSGIVGEPFDEVRRGDVVFHGLVEDGAGRTTSTASDVFEIDTAATPRTDISLQNNPSSLVPNGQTVTLTYEAVWTGGDCFGDPVANTDVVLEDQASSWSLGPVKTDLAGIVEFDLTASDLERELVAELASTECARDSLTDGDDGVASASSSNPLTVRWTDIQVDRLSATEDKPRSTLNATLDETYRAAYQVTFTDGDEPVEGAQVSLDDGSQRFSGITGADGIVRVPTQKADPTEATFSVSATFDPADGPVQENTTEDITVRWIKVQFDNLETEPVTDETMTDGWHEVSNEVRFSFDANLTYGEGTVPAGDAEIQLIAGPQSTEDVLETVTLDSQGHGETVVSFDTVTDIVPRLEPHTVPELTDLEDEEIAFDAADFGRERWTAINLSDPQPDDSFVNVGDDVTFTFSDVRWTHDQDDNGKLDDLVPSATVEIRNATEAVLATCDIQDGSATCTGAMNVVYDDGLTYAITTATNDVVRQPGGQQATENVTWTRIQVVTAAAQDPFLNVNDTATIEGTAVWEHTTEDEDDFPTPVASAVLEPTDTFPSSCTQETGEIVEGVLTLNVTCEDVVDESLGFTVMSGEEGVTDLTEPLRFNLTWTGLHVSYETVDIDDNPLPNGTLLDHNDPVRFQFNVSFAHNRTDDDGAAVPGGTFFAAFATADDGEQFNCISDTDKKSCVTEVSKTAGEFTFAVSAVSVTDTNGDGLVEEDITHVRSTPENITFRWTSIGFEEFQCEGGATGVGDCEETDWQPSEIVEVTVTAIAADSGEPLSGADITIAGEKFETDDNGQASKSFLKFSEGDITVTARGLEATIDEQTVDWTTPRSETLHWENGD